MALHEINLLPPQKLREELFRCCGSVNWVDKMMAHFPIQDMAELVNHAKTEWYNCTETDWREAFTHHPKIGDIDSLTKKFAATAELASAEQSLVNVAPMQVIAGLAKANEAYENKFHYIFIVCATGKSAEEMLAILQQRLLNTPNVEINIAMEEQNKITLLRLQKLIA